MTPYVDPDTYARLVANLERRRELAAKLRGGMPDASLAQKLAVDREIKRLTKLIETLA